VIFLLRKKTQAKEENTMLEDRYYQWFRDLTRLEELPPERFREMMSLSFQAGELNDEAVVVLLRSLTAMDAEPDEPELVVKALQEIARSREGKTISDDLRTVLRENYAADHPAAKLVEPLLPILSHARSEADLETLVELLAQRAPTDEGVIALLFAPLWRATDYPVEALFPRLLDCISQVDLAAAVLDFCNFLCRERRFRPHPAADQVATLVTLLGGISQRLAVMEEGGGKSQDDPNALSQQVQQSVAIGVSLCDALAQIGDKGAIGKLNQALDLKHRRLQTEAAAALATLGEESAEERLLELASEPICRLRVIKYAEELGIDDRLPQERITAEALAEAELALALAEPTSLGLPPTKLECIDHRTLYWPGYDDEQECFLFRFTYDLGVKQYENIGIGGPLAYAFQNDLTDTPHDDLYAAFAGWHAQHEEIYTVEPNQRARDVERYLRRLEAEGFRGIEPLGVGLIFGETSLLAQAELNGTSGVAIVDDTDGPIFFREIKPRKLDAFVVHCIYKGQRLLREYNPN